MKINKTVCAVVCGGLMAAMFTGCATQESKLAAEAKISKEDA
jgi:hypothetical protein